MRGDLIMQKKILVILALALFISVGTSSAYAENSTHEQVLMQYLGDPMFVSHLEYDYESAMEMIDNIVLQKSPIVPLGGRARQPECIVPLIRQSTSYYCGPASTLQALYGIGVASSISGSSNNEKQNALASNMGTDTSGTYVYIIVNELNNYISSVKYAYIYQGNIGSQSNFKSLIYDSLHDDRPVILHARTEKIGYYNGHKSGHYIAVDTLYATPAADGPAEHIRVRDCNYNSAYYGTHVISLIEAYASINGRYLIYAP